VSVKVLTPDHRLDPTDLSVRLFDEEIRILTVLSGNDIAPTVHESGICLGRRFFAQEYFDWPNMRDWAATSPPVAHRVEALEALIRVAGRMHGAGFVHRDITPKNILVDPRARQIRLIDFGVAVDTKRPICVEIPQVGSLRYSAPEVRDSPASA